MNKQQIIKLIEDYVNSFRIKKDACDIIDVPHSRLIQYFKGQKPISYEYLFSICEKMGYTVTINVEKK